MAQPHLGGWIAGEIWRYGTAGFRGPAERLPFVVYRCGAVAALRAIQMGSRVGLMITASHNPAEDNGIKLVEHDGSMLCPQWEEIASRIVNAGSDIVEVVNRIREEYHLPATAPTNASVYLGRDTRQSSPELSNEAASGIEWVGGGVQLVDLGICTTPMLHWCVWQGKPHITHYYDALQRAYLNSTSSPPKFTIAVDCANGVGAVAMAKVSQWRNTSFQPLNTGEGTLNHLCGADFVQKKRRRPVGFGDRNEYGASLDGDADRLILFYQSHDRGFRLIDGDRIAVFFAVQIARLVQECRLVDVRVTVVQTAYANGASTRFLHNANIESICTKTGIKHLEKAAKTADIGVYFEANGHGSLLLSDRVAQTIKEMADPAHRGTPDQKRAAQRLLDIRAVANPVVGDAIADLLLVCSLLSLVGLDFRFLDEQYEDLASRQSVVRVKDRNAIRTTDAERRVEEPNFFQPLLDDLIKSHNLRNSRCFVRPSGTEDVVRVYTEASATQREVDELTTEAEELLRKHFS